MPFLIRRTEQTQIQIHLVLRELYLKKSCGKNTKRHLGFTEQYKTIQKSRYERALLLRLLLITRNTNTFKSIKKTIF